MTTYHAHDKTALLNGTFWVEFSHRNPRLATRMQYINGDFVGYATTTPPNLQTWTKKEALKLKKEHARR